MIYEIEELSFSYDSKFTLFVENFRMSERIVGITGPSGSGKTTFLLNLGFLYIGQWKSFKFMGKQVNPGLIKQVIRQVTYVPQHPVLFRRTVFENIAYPLKIRGLPKEMIKKEVHKIAEQLQIYELLDKKAYKISGGQAKKVCLARGFVFQPKVVLLDEPTSDFDQNSKQTVETFILQMTAKSHIIIVSHDKEQLSRLCEKIFLIDDGRLHS